MADLVRLARQRIDDSPRTHWQGCERDHRECLIQRMADEIEAQRAEIERLRALLREALPELYASPRHGAGSYALKIKAVLAAGGQP